MIFVENLNGFEYIAILGEPQLDLSLIALALFNISMEGDDWEKMRLSETQKQMLTEREEAGGKDGVAVKLLSAIGPRSTAWITNKYPYNALFPKGCSYIHECFYKKDGILTLEEMKMASQDRYGKASMLIFENGPRRKSIGSIEHAHLIKRV